MMRQLLTLLLLTFTVGIKAQEETSEMGSPTFVPTVKVSKVLRDGDSIQYMEMSNVYVYPPVTFESKRQQGQYMRLVNNVKKTLPIAKQARQMLIETAEYLEKPDGTVKRWHTEAVINFFEKNRHKILYSA